MLKISIPQNPDLNKISNVVSELIKYGNKIEDLIKEEHLVKLNPKQFVFIISILAFEGKNFKRNMDFIKKYISNLPQKELNLFLTLETLLHNYFLKKYETEESYNIFYNFFSHQIYGSRHYPRYSFLNNLKIILHINHFIS